MTLLVLIDLQKGMLNRSTEHLVERVDDLCKKQKQNKMFNKVVALKFVNQPGSPQIKLLGWTRMIREEEQELLPSVQNIADEVFVKHTYTGLTAELMDYIRANGVSHVTIAGIDTDICVLATALACFEACIPCKVLEHYTASDAGEEYHKAGIMCIKHIIGHTSVSSVIY